MLDRTISFVTQGGPVMVPLFAVAVLAFGMLYERWRYFKSAGPVEPERWLEWLQTPASTRTPPPASSGLLREFLSATVQSPDWIVSEREAVIRRQEIEFRRRLEQGLMLLGMLATIAPLLGLLGTVTGMISTFQTMAGSGAADSRGLSLGISEALITTQVGLTIALPTLVGRRWIVARAERFRQALSQLSVTILSDPAVSGEAHRDA